MIRVLGIDPGTKLHGVAIIDVERSGRFSVESYGHIDAETAMRTIDEHDCLVAVELAKEIHGGVSLQHAIALARDLLLTNSHGERLRGFALGRGRETATMTAREWRKIVIGNAVCSDDQVATTLRLRSTNLPRTNVHCRDAMGVALAIADREMRLRSNPHSVLLSGVKK